MTELLLEFSPSAYLTDAQLSRLTRIAFKDPDGITLEFACWGRPLTEADVVHEPKTAADLHYEKQVETVRRAQAAAEAAGLVPQAMQTR